MPTEATAAPVIPAETAAPETETQPVLVETTAPESKSWIGMVIIGTVALFLLVGMIAVRISNSRGKYAKRRRKR